MILIIKFQLIFLLQIKEMQMTVLLNKSRSIKQHSVKSLSKVGISVVSCHFVNGTWKNNHNRNALTRPNNLTSKAQSRTPLRSLSAQRLRRKKDKKVSEKQNVRLRQEMIGNINQLQHQYDQLKLKRSYITQRESQKSGGKTRMSDLDVQSDTKANHFQSSNLLLSKCVPKSKINLTELSKHPKTTKQHYNISKASINFISSIVQHEKENINHNQSEIKQRQNSLSDITGLKISSVSENVYNKSLNNLQVIPIGLNISMGREKKLVIQSQDHKTKNQEGSRYLINTFQKRKGIKLVSCHKNSSNSSLNSSNISVYVSQKMNQGAILQRGCTDMEQIQKKSENSFQVKLNFNKELLHL